MMIKYGLYILFNVFKSFTAFMLQKLEHLNTMNNLLSGFKQINGFTSGVFVYVSVTAECS